MRHLFIAAFILCFSPFCLAQTPCPPGSLRVDGGASVDKNCQPESVLLADKYPGDVGIANDPDVIWHENFEAASISAITSRYHVASNPAGLSFDSSVPAKSRGSKSLRFYSTTNSSNDQTTDLFRNFGSGYDEIYVRYYVRYQPRVQWHHSGMWIGGYNPATDWPNPRAGTRPNGDERFSVGFEPKGGQNASSVQLDFYNYWRGMRSWQDPPPTGNSGFFGNNVLHDTRAMASDGEWDCVELHVKMNEPSSASGGELSVWTNDILLRQFSNQSPLGYWVRDKFCPNDTTDRACTDFKPANPALVPLDLRWRTTSALKVNHIWMNNYLSGGASGAMWMDDVVVAKRRIGCIR